MSATKRCNWRLRLVRICSFSFSLALATPAVAQEERPTTHELFIHGVGPDLQVAVRLPGAAGAHRGAPLLMCEGDCSVQLPEGPYTLIAIRGDRRSSRDINLVLPLRVTATAPDDAARRAGLTLGIVGVVAASVGSLIAFVGALQSIGGDEDGGRSPWNETTIVGLAVFGAGAVLIPVGFSGFAANRAPSLEIARK